MRSSTETIIAAMRILAADIQSPDGVANSAIHEAADRLEELSKSQSEPVVWMWTQQSTGFVYFENSGDPDHNWIPLYAHPPKRQPLSDAEINQIIIDEQIPVKTGNTAKKFARAIEKAHGIE